MQKADFNLNIKINRLSGDFDASILSGVENLDMLLSIPGVDGVFIGPSDLSVQLGVPRQWTSKLLLNTIEGIIKKTREKKMSCGCHWSFNNAIENQYKWVNECGMNMVIHSSDMVLYRQTLNKEINEIKHMLGREHKKSYADDKNYVFTPGNDGRGQLDKQMIEEDV